MLTETLIEKQLNSNISFVQKIEALMLKVGILDNNERDMLLSAFSRNSISHFLAMNILIEKKLYNSAFALVRIFFENLIRLKYMYYIMDDTKIKTLYNAKNWDNHFPKISHMVEYIDKVTETNFYSNIKSTAYKNMCDYTHTGPNQIARNFNESTLTIESNFEDTLILDTLKGNKVLLKTSIVVFLENIGFKNKFITEDEMEYFLKY